MTIYKILVGSYTDSIYTLEFDSAPSEGCPPTLRYLSQVNVGDYPSWIEAHPSDRSLIFACLEQAPDGQVVVIKYDQDGNGRKIDEATCASGGADPCALLVTGDELLIANYTSSTLAIVPISTHPPYTRPTELWTLTFPFVNEPDTKPSLNDRHPTRQDAAHPHHIVLNPLNTIDERELLVPDLGSDRVWRLTKGLPDSRWAVRDAIRTQIGGGPRHVAVYGETLYVLLELASKLAAYRFHRARDSLAQQSSQLASVTHATTVSTLTQSPTPSGVSAAEILIPKLNDAFPTAYIYTSNRDDPHPEGDTIAIFSLEKGEERPELVGETRTGMTHVRGMAFGGEDDRWLILAGVGNANKGAGPRRSGGIKIYERIDGGRRLEQVAELDNAVGSELRATSFLWL